MDSRIRTLVENCNKLGHRAMFVIVGDKGRDQVVNLHYMLSKTTVKARPSVLWCYKKDLYLSRCLPRFRTLDAFQHVACDAGAEGAFTWVPLEGFRLRALANGMRMRGMLCQFGWTRALSSWSRGEFRKQALVQVGGCLLANCLKSDARPYC